MTSSLSLRSFFMREKGVEPSLRWNWCLKPARLPFRHSRTETLFIVARFAAKVNCRRIIPSLPPHNNPKNSEGGHGREENAAGQSLRRHICCWLLRQLWAGCTAVCRTEFIWSRDKPYISPALHGSSHSVAMGARMLPAPERWAVTRRR